MCNCNAIYVCRETEYYDYGHGEAQETYESYGTEKSNLHLLFRMCGFVEYTVILFMVSRCAVF